jgi:3-hydroxybutyryl-CoA dehydrogenase
MNIDNVKNLCIVGAGNMGHQIALRAALSGFKVVCTDTFPSALEKAEAFVAGYLPGRVTKGKLTQEEADSARANITFSPTLEEAAKDADFVIEAVIENLELKRDIFAKLDKICPAHTILATNSSFIVSSDIADATSRPEKVVNMHFFNPALVMKVVEVVKGAHVSDETAEITMELTRKLDKNPVFLKKEINGFLVNRILGALNEEALYLLDQGIASFEDIDAAVVGALGHPMGPFRLMDLTGVDLNYHIHMERFRETGDPADRPSPSVVERYTQKRWGQKTGKGFYDYE